MRQYNEVMDKISMYISQSNSRTIEQFLYPFDCYRGRVLEPWEFLIIFPNLQPGEEAVIVRIL